MRNRKGAVKTSTLFMSILLLIAVIVAGFAVYKFSQPGPQQATTTTTSTPATSSTTTTQPYQWTEQVVSVIDFRGENITLKEPAKRVVVLSSYWAEVVVALGAGDKIVGIGSYVPYDEYLPMTVRNKTVVGSVFKGINIEQVVALDPDIVVMDCGYSKADEIINQIEGMGIPVVGLFMQSFSDELNAIEILGKVTGAEDRAQALKEFIVTKYNELRSKATSIPDDEKLRVVMVSGSSILKEGQLSIYANTSWGRALEDIGAVNIALGEFPSEEWAKIDFETLVSWDPDAIVIASSVSKIQEVLDKISGDPKWHSLKAYKEGRIYVVPCWSSIGGVMDWGPRDIIGREYLAHILYPDVYSDIDWRDDLEYLLKEFYGMFIPKQAFVSYSIDWREIIDMTDAEVKVPRKIERVVDFITYDTLIAFNVTDKLVGVSKYAAKNNLVKAAFPGITNVPSPGSSFSVNIENLTALDPDVVIIWPYKPDIVEQIELMKIPVVKVSLENYEDIKRLLWLIGSIFDKRDRSLELVNDMDNIVQLVQERIGSIPADERVKVLYLWSKPTKVQGGMGTVNDFVNLAGGVNVVAEHIPDKNYVEVDLERIVLWNPDLIVIWYHAKYNETTILSDQAWASINAVKNKMVFREPYYEHWNMDASLFILWLAQKMYPNEFSDMGFMSLANEYYMKWYGVTYSEVTGD